MNSTKAYSRLEVTGYSETSYEFHQKSIVEFFWPEFENSLGEEAMDAIKQQISNPFMSTATACCSNNTK